MDLLERYGVNGKMERKEFVCHLGCGTMVADVKSLCDSLFKMAVEMSLVARGEILVQRRKTVKCTGDVWTLVQNSADVPRQEKDIVAQAFWLNRVSVDKGDRDCDSENVSEVDSCMQGL